MRGGRLGRVKPTFTPVQDSGGRGRQDSELLVIRPGEDGSGHFGAGACGVEGEIPGEGQAQESKGPVVALIRLPWVTALRQAFRP
jgi:hypothetical protein